MTFLVDMNKRGQYSVINDVGEVYIYNIPYERALEIVNAWNTQDYKGIDG